MTAVFVFFLWKVCRRLTTTQMTQIFHFIDFRCCYVVMVCVVLPHLRFLNKFALIQLYSKHESILCHRKCQENKCSHIFLHCYFFFLDKNQSPLEKQYPLDSRKAIVIISLPSRLLCHGGGHGTVFWCCCNV